jgi:hypothetical protein
MGAEKAESTLLKQVLERHKHLRLLMRGQVVWCGGGALSLFGTTEAKCEKRGRRVPCCRTQRARAASGAIWLALFGGTVTRVGG